MIINKWDILDFCDEWVVELKKTFMNKKANQGIYCSQCNTLVAGYIGKSVIIFDDKIKSNQCPIICGDCIRQNKIENIIK